MTNNAELPACPFCGGKPSPISVEGHQECTNPKCCIMGQVFSLDEWRTRAEPAPCAKSQVGGPAAQAVGRYLEPGPRYRGAERVPQIRSYAEFPRESVKNSDGVWLEGEQVYTRPDGRLDPRPELAVWYGPMPESNGKTNWTALLHRKGDLFSGITIDRSEYPERVRYEADRMRHMIGELEEEPDILEYDADKHSGYRAERITEVPPPHKPALGAYPSLAQRVPGQYQMSVDGAEPWKNCTYDEAQKAMRSGLSIQNIRVVVNDASESSAQEAP